MLNRCTLALLLALAIASSAAATEYRWLPLSVYRDKMKAGWLGQMVGVSWGAPTEFRYCGRIIPDAEVPLWHDGMANDAFGQDDLYVEMTFLRTLEQRGLRVSPKAAGLDWAKSGYALWHANAAGRDNLRAGIAPPDSGHPKFSAHADDIDYQIESDFSGLIAPGLPNTAIALGEKFGRMMNYGDGLYAGQFMGGMYSEAFFESDPVKLVEFGLKCIPAQSQYAECIRDVLAWYRANPNDWEGTWRRIEDKYQKNPAYRRASCDKGIFNIDAKINGAYVVMGLLYGGSNVEESYRCSVRCGLDSDCNPSSTLGVLFTATGYDNLPERCKRGLDEKAVFSYTAYNFPALIAACEKVAREAVVRAGGKIVRRNGEEVFLIPVKPPKPSKFEQCWAPGPIANSRYSAKEIADVNPVYGAFAKWAPGWKLKDCGPDMEPGLHAEWASRSNVFVTHPLKPGVGCTLSRRLTLTAGKPALHLVVGHHPNGDWTLIVRANGVVLRESAVGPTTATNGWLDTTIDLSAYAGKAVTLELVNQPSGWMCEAAYWAKIEVVGGE